MAIQPMDLQVLAYAHGFTLWHAATDDPADAVTGDGYFDDAGQLLRPGDLILANAGGGRPPALVLLHVTEAAKGRVAVRDVLRPARSMPPP